MAPSDKKNENVTPLGLIAFCVVMALVLAYPVFVIGPPKNASATNDGVIWMIMLTVFIASAAEAIALTAGRIHQEYRLRRFI